MLEGLHPESHGIVGYEMYDAVYDEVWKFWNTDPKWWNGGEPIWVTARRQGQESGSYFWLGSEVRIRGYRPNHWLKYNESIPFKARVDEVIRWFTEEEADVVTLYFNEPDYTGHATGPAPGSRQTVAKIREADDVVGYILEKMEANGLLDTINLIVTSDHGMTDCDVRNKVINVYDHVPYYLIKIIADEGAVANILPEEGKTQQVYEALKGVHPNMSVYYKQFVPEKYHYKHHRRIHPVVAIADEGWLIIGVSYNITVRTGPLYRGKLQTLVCKDWFII